jgi:ABC-type antimicrobial peptide transport system permease subunit
MPVEWTRTIAEVMASQRREVLLAFAGILAASGLGLLLSAIGLYAVTSAAVRHRSGEIGLRATLGANPGTILWIFLREGLRLSLIGIVLGLPAGLLLLRMTTSDTGDMAHWTHLPAGLLTALLVVAVALLASWLPARRAAAVDPMTVLRVE